MKDLKILLIDSSNYDLSKIEKILDKSDYKLIVESIDNLEELRKIIQKKTFDIIFTEIKIHNFSYEDVIQILKEKNSEIPIILFSNNINIETALTAVKNGINDYLEKEITERIILVVERELRESESRSARKMAEEALYYMAYHDPLTGLSNRYDFESKLNDILQKVKLNPENNYSLLYLDLDQFKIVNDTCGHQAGDDLLRNVSVTLTQLLKKKGFAARIGGDEFVIILENYNLKEANELANQLLQKISEIRFIHSDKVFTIGGSIGLLQIKATYTSIGEILSLADLACYSAKESGRNRIHISDEDDKQGIFRMEEMNWSTKLKTSLELNQFTLFKQPIVSIPYNGDSTVFYEFLLRLKTDTKDLVMPDVFLRAAERYNMMPSIDRWVVNHALSYIHKNQENIKRLKNKPCFFINLSGASLSDITFFKFIDEKMKEYDIEPTLLCFEITETVAISDLNKTVSFIQSIRKKGSHFALDDFGSGMSSFSYLKKLPVDFLKIDGAFIRDMTEGSLDYTIVESINKVAKVVGLITIGEFVENLATLDLLKNIGIDFAQGYAISYPTPID